MKWTLRLCFCDDFSLNVTGRNRLSRRDKASHINDMEVDPTVGHTFTDLLKK